MQAVLSSCRAWAVSVGRHCCRRCSWKRVPTGSELANLANCGTESSDSRKASAQGRGKSPSKSGKHLEETERLQRDLEAQPSTIGRLASDESELVNKLASNASEDSLSSQAIDDRSGYAMDTHYGYGCYDVHRESAQPSGLFIPSGCEEADVYGAAGSDGSNDTDRDNTLFLDCVTECSENTTFEQRNPSRDCVTECSENMKRGRSLSDCGIEEEDLSTAASVGEVDTARTRKVISPAARATQCRSLHQGCDSDKAHYSSRSDEVDSLLAQQYNVETCKPLPTTTQTKTTITTTTVTTTTACERIEYEDSNWRGRFTRRHTPSGCESSSTLTIEPTAVPKDSNFLSPEQEPSPSDTTTISSPGVDFSGKWVVADTQGDMKGIAKKTGVSWALRQAAALASYGKGMVREEIVQHGDDFVVTSTGIKENNTVHYTVGTGPQEADKPNANGDLVISDRQWEDQEKTILVVRNTNKSTGKAMPTVRRYLQGQYLMSEISIDGVWAKQTWKRE